MAVAPKPTTTAARGWPFGHWRRRTLSDGLTQRRAALGKSLRDITVINVAASSRIVCHAEERRVAVR